MPRRPRQRLAGAGTPKPDAGPFLDVPHLRLHHSRVRLSLAVAFALVVAVPTVAHAQCPDGTLPPCTGTRETGTPARDPVTPGRKTNPERVEWVNKV